MVQYGDYVRHSETLPQEEIYHMLTDQMCSVIKAIGNKHTDYTIELYHKEAKEENENGDTHRTGWIITLKEPVNV